MRSERWAAASGYAAVVLGAGGVAFERRWPGAGDAGAFPVFIADNRGAIVAQSMLFVLGAGFFMWFLGSLRGFLVRAEGGVGRLSTVAFAAGMIGYGLSLVGQAPQITLALPAQAGMAPATAAVLADLGYVMVTIANVPLAVMFAAVAVVSLRTRVFPAWLGWLAVFAAVAALVLSFAVVKPTGPLAPQGWASYVLYPASIVWLVPAVTVMIRRLGRTPSGPRGAGRCAQLVGGPG
jgi:hypothetical protein